MSAVRGYCSVVQETNYGTAAASGSARSIEDKGDDWKVQTSPVDVGDTQRADQQTDLAHNYAEVIVGAEGSTETAFYDKGMGLLVKGLLGDASAPTAVPSTTNGRYGRNYRTAGIRDNPSMTIRRGRPRRLTAGGYGLEEFVYAGCVAKSFELSVKKNDPWMLKIEWDAQTETAGGAATTQTYADPTTMFHWANTSILVNGQAVDFEEFDLSGDFNVVTDDNPLSGSANKLKPEPQGRAMYSGNLNVGRYSEAHATNVYERFKSSALTSVVVECKKRPANYTASPAVDHSLDILRVTLSAVRFTGSTPQSPPNSLPQITNPFKVFWDGQATSYAVDMYLQNGDATD